MPSIRAILILLVGFAGISARAQDPHFSMYQLAPMAVNPAFTGLIPNEGSHRLTVNHRAQWAQAGSMRGFQTSTFSYSTALCELPVPGHFALGLNLMNDRAGFSPLRRLHGSMLVSYTRQLSGRNGYRSDWGGGGLFLSAGFEFGGIQHSLDPSGLRFDEQFDGRDYDPSLPGETFDRDVFFMGDLGAGLLLHSVGKNWADGGFSLGGSYKHINQPAYRFLDNTQDPEGLPALLNLHGSVTMGRERSAGLLRMLFMSQGAYRQYLVGGELLSRFGNKRANNPNFMLGLAYRASRYLDTGFHSDAAVISLQTQVSSKLQIAASYDLSLSSVRRVSNNGAFELALQLVFAGRWKCPTRCPDF